MRLLHQVDGIGVAIPFHIGFNSVSFEKPLVAYVHIPSFIRNIFTSFPIESISRREAYPLTPNRS